MHISRMNTAPTKKLSKLSREPKVTPVEGPNCTPSSTKRNTVASEKLPDDVNEDPMAYMTMSDKKGTDDPIFYV